jgi:hypothetical protein
MANKKIFEDLVELTTSAADDVLPIVDDTTGTPTTKHITVANLMLAAPVQSVAGRDGVVTLSNTDISGLGTAATSASTDFSPAFFSIVAETTTARTLSDSDNGKVIACSNSGQSIVTIPSGLTSGFSCTIVQSGTGTVSVIGSVGAVVSGLSNKTATAGQYAALNVIPVGTNAYILDGDGITAPLVNSNSVDLDGTNQYIDTAATLTLQSASVWIKPDSTIQSSSGGQVVLGGGGTNYRPLFLGDATSYVSNEVVGVAFGLGALGTGSGVTLSNSSWNHIFIAWQTSSQSNGGSAGYDFWINGVLQTTASGAQSGGTPPTSPMSIGSLDIGRRQNSTQYYAGLVDEVALWSTDVSADIATVYNSGKPDDLNNSSVVSTAPVNWWRMGDNNNGTGTTISDQGSVPADGTLTNGPTFSSDVP